MWQHHDVRFVFAPPAESTTGLLSLPWREPMVQWTDDRLVEIRQRGISRHVVRFVAEGAEIYALKELDERLARREYRLLRELGRHGHPGGRGARRGGGPARRPRRGTGDAVSRPFHLLPGAVRRPRGGQPTDQLLDAMVELLARLHLAGFMWGDCSLSNTLFRLDAGALAAYLVDAETSELHPTLSDGKRSYDVELAFERVGGELFDLQAGGLLPSDVDPVEVAEEIPRRYAALWSELTREDTVLPAEQRFRIAERLRRLNELGFDVDEVELVDAGGTANKLRMRTRVAEPGHHRRLLFTRTGLVAQENQARRLLNDIASYRSHLERKAGRSDPRGGGGEPLAVRGVRPGGGRDPGPPARPAGRGGGVPRDPGAPLVPVRGGRSRHRDDRGPRRLLRPGAAQGPRRPDHHRPRRPRAPTPTPPIPR